METVKIGIKPLLKWPGGKRSIIPQIRSLVPDTFGRYYEPFLGGGALFFSLCPKQAVLADTNSNLIECYTVVRDHPEDLIARLQELTNSKEDYYRIRAWHPESALDRSVRLVYLTTLSFNGIYRENLQGKFNVPYGRKTHLKPCDPEIIRNASKALANAKLIHSDFQASLKGIRAGDLVYLDPPYTVAHSNNGFIKYNAKIFSWDDQVRLAKVAGRLVARGCHVIVSNADHESLRKLYKDFQVLKVARSSVIAASSQFRGRATECLFYKGVP